MISDTCCSALHSISPSPRSHSIRLSSNNSRRFDWRDGHDIWCKVAVAGARKGDALGLYHKTIVESSSKRYCGWKAHAWSGRWGLLPSTVGIRAIITIEMNEKGIRWLPARGSGV